MRKFLNQARHKISYILLRGDTTRCARSKLLTTGVRRARNPPLGIFAEEAGPLFIYMKRRKSLTSLLNFSIHSHLQNSYLKPISARNSWLSLPPKERLICAKPDVFLDKCIVPPMPTSNQLSFRLTVLLLYAVPPIM